MRRLMLAISVSLLSMSGCRLLVNALGAERCEGDEPRCEGNTLLTTARPALLKQFYSEPELKPIFERWEKDLVEIMDDVREAK